MKKSTKTALITSISAVIGIVVLVGAGIIVTTLVRGIGGQIGTYSAIVQRFDASQKSFKAGEVAEVGPYDVTTSMQEAYVPTEAEAAAVQKVFARNQRSDSSKTRPDYYGYSFTEETGQYVRVTLALKYNAARSEYAQLNASSKDWIQQFDTLTLNDMMPLVVAPALDEYQVSQEVEAMAKDEKGSTVTLLYRVPKTVTVFTLQYDISIFTKISIVGTEGMPRQSYEYTIGIQ